MTSLTMHESDFNHAEEDDPAPHGATALLLLWLSFGLWACLIATLVAAFASA